MTDLPEIPAAVLRPDSVEALDRAILNRQFDHPAVSEAVLSDDDEAAWAMARVIEAQEAVAQTERMAKAWRDRITEWETAATALPYDVIGFLTDKLRGYVLAVRASSGTTPKGEPKIKSVKLPNGDLRTSGRSIGAAAITDEAALLAWAKTNLPDAVQTTEKVLMPKLSAATSVRFVEGAVYGQMLTVDGEVVPGVVVERGTTTATVHPGS